MFKPNQFCTITKMSGTDVYGQPVQGAATTEQCAVIELDVKANKTPIRGDSSASRGSAIESETVARLLMTPGTVVDIDDMLTIVGINLRVSSRLPQFTIHGTVDHYQISCSFWGYQ